MVEWWRAGGATATLDACLPDPIETFASRIPRREKLSWARCGDCRTGDDVRYGWGKRSDEYPGPRIMDPTCPRAHAACLVSSRPLDRARRTGRPAACRARDLTSHVLTVRDTPTPLALAAWPSPACRSSTCSLHAAAVLCCGAAARVGQRPQAWRLPWPVEMT